MGEKKKKKKAAQSQQPVGCWSSAWEFRGYMENNDPIYFELQDYVYMMDARKILWSL